MNVSQRSASLFLNVIGAGVIPHNGLSVIDKKSILGLYHFTYIVEGSTSSTWTVQTNDADTWTVK